jgi:transposase
MLLPSDLPITEEDWSQTPPSVQAVVISLWQQLQVLQVLQAQVDGLQEEVLKLREQLGRNSQNSSQPPSSDGPKAPERPKRTPSGRKAGGQKGHEGHGRELLPPEQVARTVKLKPVLCAGCGALLLGEDTEPVRHQVTEVPRIEAEVTEYQQHTLTCLVCGEQTTAEWPVDMPTGGFGARTQAMVGYLTGRMGASQRDTEEMLETLFHTDMSLGSVSDQQAEVSVALAEPVKAAIDYAQQQPAKNVDETSWREGTQRTWLWINATSLVTVFMLIATRGGQGAKQLLGVITAADFVRGIVGSDRWLGYNWLDPQQRQLCWAHLKRDFQALVERGGESMRIGQALLGQVELMFGLWHRIRDGTLSRPDFQAAMQPIQTRVGILLREGSTLACAKTQRTCANLLKLEVALWTFVRVAGVEPTNNAAERPLRRAVLWRRRSFGTQSADGSRFVERILTAVTTLRQQKRDVLDYLTEACAASIRGSKAPSLLPIAPEIHTVS